MLPSEPPDSAFEIADYALMARLVRAGFATTLAPVSAISGEMLAGLLPFPSMTARLRLTLSRPSAGHGPQTLTKTCTAVPPR